MGRIRKCDSRCHKAKGKRCRCWCGGAFHGAGGAVNHAALANGAIELLEEHGFRHGETAYIQQTELPIGEVEVAGGS